jgi:hypothetical protein
VVKYTNDDKLPAVTDQMLTEALPQTRPYTLVILKIGPKFSPAGPDRGPEVAKIIWQHGKRNYALRLAGLLRIVCPVADGGDVAGVGIFDASAEDVETIMCEDPAVKASVLEYEIHPTRSFPGSCLPAEPETGA